MKAITYHRYGSPDVLKLADVQKPTPADDEVLVKMKAVSINSWDWDMLTGTPFEYRMGTGLFKPKRSLLHGCDIAGIVEAVGLKVTQFRVGDAVFGDLSEGGWGAFAEYRCVDERELRRKPESMTFEQASCLPHGGNLAVQGLIDAGQLKAGQTVLINGGGGSTGTLAIQMAKMFDVEVTAVDRPEKFELMRSLGADHVIDYTTDDFTAQGDAYDLIFDVKSTRSMFAIKRALKPNGSYVTVGGHTSRILQLLLLKTFMGPYHFHMVMYQPNKDLDVLIQWFEAGKLKPIIDTCFPLEETAKAFRMFGEGQCAGNVVVTVNG